MSLFSFSTGIPIRLRPRVLTDARDLPRHFRPWLTGADRELPVVELARYLSEDEGVAVVILDDRELIAEVTIESIGNQSGMVTIA